MVANMLVTGSGVILQIQVTATVLLDKVYQTSVTAAQDPKMEASVLTDYRNWDEERVAEWLRSINCSQYVSLFLKNNITGSNLMELDAPSLKEIGILKMGDRKRIEAQAKKFRASEYKRISKRVTNRVCTKPAGNFRVC